MYNNPEDNFEQTLGILFEECGGKQSGDKESPDDFDASDPGKYFDSKGAGVDNQSFIDSKTNGKTVSDIDYSKCKTDAEMREYMTDKTIVVYAEASYVSRTDQEPNENELVTYLTPIVEKRLDYRLSKIVNTVV